MKMNKETIYMLIFLCSVLISSISQIMLKKSANKKYTNKMQEYLNPWVIIAYGMFFGATLITTIAYKVVPLSMGPLLEATGYIWVAILGRILLEEHVGKKKIVGIVLIFLGIVITYKI